MLIDRRGKFIKKFMLRHFVCEGGRQKPSDVLCKSFALFLGVHDFPRAMSQRAEKRESKPLPPHPPRSTFFELSGNEKFSIHKN